MITFIDSCSKTAEKIDNAKKTYRKKKESVLVGVSQATGLNPKKRDTPIACPLCGKEFKPCNARIVGDSTLTSVAKGTIFLPWGMASSMKGRGIECPNCHMVLKML